MLQLTQINIYPVKSLDGYSPNRAIVAARGLQYDRRWMIVDEIGKFMTQRTEPKMALLRAVIEDDKYLVIYEKKAQNNQIKISIAQTNDIFSVEIWDDTVKAFRVSAEADNFLTNFLGKTCHLVTMNEQSSRPIDPDFALQAADEVSFADGFPILLIGEAAAELLRGQLPTDSFLREISALELLRRFRPNLIFSGGEPHDEDMFKKFRIGEVDFVAVKPCARCILTTRDPDTGVSGKEPLRTLKNYRERKNKILFGQNIIWNKKIWQWAWKPEIYVGDIFSFV
jgi:uncharacterized protein YcbX